MLELQRTRGLSDTEILAHQLTFHFDGFETSATLISHCLLLVIAKKTSSYKLITTIAFQLARNTDKQEQLRAEIRDHMIANSNVLDFPNLMKLPYLEQCVAGNNFYPYIQKLIFIFDVLCLFGRDSAHLHTSTIYD